MTRQYNKAGINKTTVEHNVSNAHHHIQSSTGLEWTVAYAAFIVKQHGALARQPLLMTWRCVPVAKAPSRRLSVSRTTHIQPHCIWWIVGSSLDDVAYTETLPCLRSSRRDYCPERRSCVNCVATLYSTANRGLCQLCPNEGKNERRRLLFVPMLYNYRCKPTSLLP